MNTKSKFVDVPWVACGLPWLTYGGTLTVLPSFCGQRLNVPGTQIEVEGEVYLIGDINPNRGVCDDCTEFRSSAIVTRYRVLIPHGAACEQLTRRAGPHAVL